MTDHPQALDAAEADDMGEKPDLGRTPDHMVEELTGTDAGSDTRAGSLQGGSASGSDDDSDQEIINETLASEGMASVDPQSPSGVSPGAVKNTGGAPGDQGEAGEDPAEGKRDADAATG